MKKLEILKAYLQQMYLGSGIYGIESGARAMFGKSTGELCREQAAVIAAMMVYPRPLDPSSGWNERIMRRATYGLKLFDRLGQRYKRHASTCR
jgi:membrane peptidoglycan carboxypeptidase